MMYATTLIWPPTSPTQGLKWVRAIRRTDRRARQGLRRVSPSYYQDSNSGNRNESADEVGTRVVKPLGARLMSAAEEVELAGESNGAGSRRGLVGLDLSRRRNRDGCPG